MDVRTVIAIVAAGAAVVTFAISCSSRVRPRRYELTSVAACLLIVAGCFQLASVVLTS
jgi:uncharacterized membrane protein YidH (DUF202 family)